MKKFLYNVFQMLTIVSIGYCFIVMYVSGSAKINNSYLSSIIDKHKRIKEIKSPKIILAGGSNLAFGINSEKIQNEFSVPVVNLGLHAGLGLEFMVNELKELIKEKDVVFISIEYFLDKEGKYELKNHIRLSYPNAANYYHKNIKKEIQLHIVNTRKNLKRLNQKGSDDVLHSVYSSQSFNKYGDVVGHLDQLPPKIIEDRFKFNYRYWEGIEILNDFNNYAKSKNVNVFFLFPNYPGSEYMRNEVVLSKLENNIIRNLSFEVINIPQDFLYNDGFFFDTVYHLNKEGREIRTIKLIEIMHKNKNVSKILQDIRNAEQSISF